MGDGWKDTHAHEFRIGDQVIAPDWWIKEGSPDLDTGNYRDERRVGVGTAVSEAGTAGEIGYLYDIGDDWRHRLVVEPDVGRPTRKFNRVPLCIAGEDACPPDDVGGPHGYARFLTALADPDDEEHTDFATWIGGVFDPHGFDLNHINRDWHSGHATTVPSAL